MRSNRQRAEEASTPDRTSQPLTSRGVDGAQPASDVPADRGGFDRAEVAHFSTDAGSIDPVAIGDPGRGVGVTRRSDPGRRPTRCGSGTSSVSPAHLR